ncbi:MAG: FGGY-family carbohydrate kinase [Candidatus Limiplasma sp.]|nr:FGGY-family carbohydrate kinase [Candidatus Limiplasma sp.]
MRYIIAYDLGTGGTKASVFTEHGEAVASAFLSIRTLFTPGGFHEQRPEDWWGSVVQSTRRLLSIARVEAASIVGLAVSGHSLAAAPLQGDGALLTGSTPIWTDSRAGAQAKRFFAQVDETRWYTRTGNGFPAPQYALFKIMWLKEHQPEVYAKAACFLGTKDYVNYRLTGVMATDHSYASGSGCYDLRAMAYDQEYIRAAGIDGDKLPQILASSDITGHLTAEAAKALGLAQGIPVAAGGVDNACMALGAACIADGDAYTSLGTSAWIAVASHEPIVNPARRSYVFAHCVPGMFASATCIFSAGNSLRWVKNVLCPDVIQRAEQERADAYDLMTAMAATSPPGANRLLFNPSLAGGSATEKSPDIRGAFLGLTLSHTREDVLRATLEGVALNLRLSLDVMRQITPIGDDMLIVGGGGRSRLWRQIFANVYGMNILETNVGQDAGSLGAMACAAVGTGLWKGFDEVRGVHRLEGRVSPQPKEQALYGKLLPVFARAADMQADLGEELARLSL